MSNKPPGASGQPAASGSSGNNPSSSSSAQQDHTSIVLEYLLKRGYHGAAQALRAELDPTQKPPAPATAAQPAPATAAAASSSQALPPAQPQAIVAGGRSVSQEAFERRQLGGNSQAARIGANGRPLVREDPMPWRDGLLGLREFVHGSLDIHRPELLPILLPVYFHSIIDLILLGYKDQAESIFRSFVNDYQATNPAVVNLLASLKTPTQIFENEQAARWRRERYVVKMTRRGWSLLLGWLQGGSQGLLGHTAQGGEQAERGREKMLGIINERVRVDVVDPKLAPTARLLSGGGLESELATDASGPTPASALPPPLKLGPMPIDPKLSKEVQRTLQTQGLGKSSEEAGMQVDSAMGKASGGGSSATYAIPPVNASDLPPYPPSFRTIDVKREVEKIKEARRRIRLGPTASSSTSDGKLSVAALGGPASQAKYNLPSVCMFTMHDTSDSLISAEFSEDSSILACGFSESYIRLWNLKGDPLEDTRSDFDASSMQTSSDLKKLRRSTDASGTPATTRKLVAHSGPVYAMSFDPLPGPSGPPRYLLSASQDSTVRLWSLDTYTNIVAYRGHRDPVWDVEWGPRGVYFATASRDRTARLWTTERIAAVRIFAGHLSDVDCVKFHPNSLYLATGSSDRTCRLWDVQKGTCVRVFAGHSGAVSTVAISPDGRYLASAGTDAKVNLWDLGTSRLIKSMAGHSGKVNSLSFGAESTVLVSGSEDCTVRVWDVQTARTGALSVQNAFTSGAGNREASERAGDQTNNDLLVTLSTKRTPVYTTKFTPRNLCLAAGPIS